MEKIIYPNKTIDWIQSGEPIDDSITNRPIKQLKDNVDVIKTKTNDIVINFNALLGQAEKWSSDNIYNKDNIVRYDDKLWISKKDNNTEKPGTGSKWTIFEGFQTSDSILKFYNKKLDNRNIIKIKYNNDNDIDIIRYEGDDDSSIFYRSVMGYDNNKKLTEVKYYYNNSSNASDAWNGKLTLTYDDNDNLVSTKYEEQ